MRWVDADAFPACSLDPSAEDAAAGKDEDVHLAAIAHSQFEVAVERRDGYGLPHDRFFLGSQGTDVLIWIVFPPSSFIGEQPQSLPKLIAPGQLQPTLCKAKVIGTQLFILNSPSPTSAFLGVLVTLANFFAEVFKQSFLPTLKMRLITRSRRKGCQQV
jgi:hypothetical protein